MLMTMAAPGSGIDAADGGWGGDAVASGSRDWWDDCKRKRDDQEDFGAIAGSSAWWGDNGDDDFGNSTRRARRADAMSKVKPESVVDLDDAQRHFGTKADRREDYMRADSNSVDPNFRGARLIKRMRVSTDHLNVRRQSS